jgi:feruloyl-CoA synthase
VFDGRVAEDFKLSTGTWVHVGAIRVKLIAAGNPVIQDAVITGHDRNDIGALVFLSPAAKDADVRAVLSQALKTLSKDGGSSMHPTRLLVMTEPPQIDAGESPTRAISTSARCSSAAPCWWSSSIRTRRRS